MKIATRLKPFTHIPGTPLLLPGTWLEFRIFPALIEIRDLHSSFIKRIEWPVVGPSFTVMSDLEKGCIHVFGGKMRYTITPSFEKGGVFIGDLFVNAPSILNVKAPQERLSLGNHKQQDWDLVTRRRDLKEILPAWFLLSKWQSSGLCVEREDLLEIFLSRFVGILSPRSEDEKFQGFTLPPLECSPLACAIESLFMTSMDDSITLLPHLPKECFCGRMLSFSVLGGGALLHFEWIKKSPFRMIIQGLAPKTFHVHAPSEIKAFRVRSSLKEKGVVSTVDASLSILPGQCMYLDRFFC